MTATHANYMRLMRQIRPFRVYPWLILLASLTASAQAQSTNVKALVGGTLIDGYGSTAIRNSVVIIEGRQIGRLVLMTTSTAVPRRSMTKISLDTSYSRISIIRITMASTLLATLR